MKKKAWLIIVSLALVVLLSGIVLAKKTEKDKEKDFKKVKHIPSIRGKVTEVRSNANVIVVSVFKKGKMTNETKILKVSPLTKLYYKKRGGQLDATALRAKISDFKKGDSIIAIAKSVEGRVIPVDEIWETRAFLAYTGSISTEVEYKGTVEEVNKTKKTLRIRNIADKKSVSISVGKITKISVKNRPGNLPSIKKGDKVYIRCRWRGYLEDKPAVIPAVEITDAATYVIHTMRQRFGPVIGHGKVLAMDMKKKTIKIGTAGGSAKTISFITSTKWVFGTSKIKSPKDLVGIKVYAFGKAAREKKSVALEVVNENALPGLFDYLVKTGGKVGGQRTVLGLGQLLSLDSSRVSVKIAGGRHVSCKLHKKAVFIRKGKKVKMSDIRIGDWVKLEGFITPRSKKDIAVVVISFGPPPESLKKYLEK
ncbi:MAG: hypothetical protein K8T10_00920 [Candidatus Eremiobacteraeota bacterium]|nr:hypothetical protein [Candidatus Eremiobacteraeota bacterium]